MRRVAAIGVLVLIVGMYAAVDVNGLSQEGKAVYLAALATSFAMAAWLVRRK